MITSNKLFTYLRNALKHIPNDWVHLTTHRLDIYNEDLAKTQFLEQFETLYEADNYKTSAFDILPTAYDYIRLGHPLSCILEWTIAKLHNLKPEKVIAFGSKTTPILAILRKNLMDGKQTRLICNKLPECFDAELVKTVYGYNFEIVPYTSAKDVTPFDGSNVLISETDNLCHFDLNPALDFLINISEDNLGSILISNGDKNEAYISSIQHVRRRETVAITPSNALKTLKKMALNTSIEATSSSLESDKKRVLDSIRTITKSNTTPLVGSSGLSIQYAIMMGLINDALINHPKKDIKFIVPPNCYGGTNDQARRVAACLPNVEILDLPVDGNNDMVKSIDNVLEMVANYNAVPYIIAEIPTNPRVEVPDLQELKTVLSKPRETQTGAPAVDPVFILDQTFCPNVLFLNDDNILATVKTISYASGSKFPSGGKCTAGYCVSNRKAAHLMAPIERHLLVCDNEATSQQYCILAEQLPSMLQRIKDAYTNTREFVTFIQKTLPTAKINFVSENLAAQGFTPSVFSLDLPTKGSTDEERETYKRALNLKLINLMITEMPSESKFCVSYGQLKGCYWTIPATSTQGTTKEGDKDYIVRASLSPDLNLEGHKTIFSDFVLSL